MLGYDRKRIKGWAKSKVPFLWERRLGIALGLITLAALILFREIVGMLVVMAAFIFLGVLSMMYNRWVKVSIGVELIMLGMVMTTVLYGRAAGLVVGFVALFLAEMLTDRFTYSTFVSFIGIAGVVVAVPLFGNAGIMWKGILATLLYDVIIAPGYIIMGSSPWRTLLFVATHIMFNVWVFAFIAPPLFGLLS